MPRPGIPSIDRAPAPPAALWRVVSVLVLLMIHIAFESLAAPGNDASGQRTVESEGGLEPAKSLRLVSLNPSLTAIVRALGAEDQLVGIDDYSARVIPALADLPRVGGLFDPSLERVVSLRPDRVLIVAGVDQERHADRLARLGIEVEIYRNVRLAEVLDNIERLGILLGRSSSAARRIRSIVDTRAAVKQAVRGLPRPRTLAIVDRAPLFLVGAETFLDEMLDAVGAENLARRLAKGFPRGSIEWLIDARPELLLDLTPGDEPASAFWARWPSLPAVSAGRVVDLDPGRISLPGPDLDRALVELAVAVHGPEIERAIGSALSRLAREGPRP